MEIRLLKEDYIRSKKIYRDFLENNIEMNEDNFSDDIVIIDDIPDFPIYMNVKEEERLDLFMKAFKTLADSYLKLDRGYHFNGVFWHSLLCTKKRDMLIKMYPKIIESEKDFRNIVLKKFDWENYIYKSILGAQYITDNIKEKYEQERYFELIVNNLDLYNYIIKYEIFRNDKFLLNVLDIVDYNNLSENLKVKIKGREDLGDDERVGRRVIFELNKSYPVVLSPMLEKEELESYFIENLKKYQNN